MKSYDVRNEKGEHIHGAYAPEWLPRVGEFLTVPTWNKTTAKHDDKRYSVVRVEHTAYIGAIVVVREA